MFWPSENVIIWDQMKPFFVHSMALPYVRNIWNTQLYIDELCIFDNWINESLLWGEYCKSPKIDEEILIPWWQYDMPDRPIFIWDISGISSWKYSNNELMVSLKHNSTLFEEIYSESQIKVRVSKPSIVTVWGWTSFVDNTSDIANITDVADAEYSVEKISNKNFVWAGVTTDISSYSKNVDNNLGSMDKIALEWDYYNKSINRVTNSIWSIAWITISNIGDYNNYHWLEKVFILKDKNFEIWWTTFNWLSGPRTYIVENGNLIISDDFDYLGNIAFVVKWWNIIVNSNVANITWVFISIKEESSISWVFVWWEIRWNWTVTKDILKVDWALYWNITDLVSQRIYILPMNWQINVWTIVNFWSSNFHKPAPLIWKFIWDYLEAQKVAK